MKYTPGPWETKFEEAIRIKDIKGNTVCIVTHLTKAGRRESSESEANAYLIAAAPELLEDLESRYIQTKCGCGHPACNRCEDDRETKRVLNKAKGGGGGHPNEIQHLKARIAKLEKQNDCSTVWDWDRIKQIEEQKSILEFVEPHPTGGTCYVRISKEQAIAWQKRKWPQATDEDALEDFKIIHRAFEV